MLKRKLIYPAVLLMAVALIALGAAKFGLAAAVPLSIALTLLIVAYVFCVIKYQKAKAQSKANRFEVAAII